MSKNYTSKRTTLFVWFIAILLVTVIMVIIIKPYFFHKQPFKLFGYVAYNTTVNEGYAYTTANKGFYVSRILDDGSIKDNYLFKTNDTCFGIDVIEGDLFVGYESGNLIQYDITDPENISEISSIYLNETVLGIAAKDNVIYVSTTGGSIFAITLIDLTIIDTYSLGNEYIRDVQVYNNYLLYASIDSGVGILDITDPENLTFVKKISNTSASFDINIYDNKLFVSRHQYGLFIFEISDNNGFTLIENIDISGEVYSSAFDGTYLIIGDLQEGIEKWQYDESTNGFEYLDTFKRTVPHHLYIYDNYIVTADQDRGLFIIPLVEE